MLMQFLDTKVKMISCALFVNVFAITGPVFGSKDFFVGLAIIADTYSNHNGPHNVSFI